MKQGSEKQICKTVIVRTPEPATRDEQPQQGTGRERTAVPAGVKQSSPAVSVALCPAELYGHAGNGVVFHVSQIARTHPPPTTPVV